MVKIRERCGQRRGIDDKNKTPGKMDPHARPFLATDKNKYLTHLPA